MALASSAALAVAGCGSSSSSGGSTSASKPSTSASKPSTSASKPGTGTASAGAPDLHGVTISYLGFGGITDQTMDKAWFKPFEQATGAKVTLDSPTDYKKLQVQVQSGNVSYDLVDGDAFVMDPGCGKSWEKLNLPNVTHVLPAYQPKTACTAPDYIYSYVIAYSPRDFPNGGPQTCSDFFDTTKFPGKRQSWSYYYGDLPECAAVAAGANEKNPYPLNIDAVTSKVKSLKGQLQLFDTTQQAADAMANNDVATGIYTTRMVYQGQLAGASWRVGHGWASTANGTFGIPKGAPHRAAAQALLNYILDPVNNRRFYEDLPNYGSPEGVKPASAAKLDPYLVSGSPELLAAGSLVNWAWWAQNDPAFSQKWLAATTG